MAPRATLPTQDERHSATVPVVAQGLCNVMADGDADADYAIRP